MFGDEVEQITHFDPLTGEVFAKLDTVTVFLATQYVTRSRRSSAPRTRSGTSSSSRSRSSRARGGCSRRTDPAADGVRHGDDASSASATGSRTTRGSSTRPTAYRHRTPCSTTSLRLRRLRRRVAPDDPAGRRHVRGRPLAQADARRPRLPAPVRARQPPARFDEFLDKVNQLVRLGDAGPVRAAALAGRGGAADPADVPVDPEVELRPTKNQIDDLLNEIRRREEALSAPRRR